MSGDVNLIFCYNQNAMLITTLKKIGLLALIFLAACTILPQQDSPEVFRQKLQGQLVNLPGAVISADGLTISYPAENLFAVGAVLPMPGGMEVLDPLLELLLQNSQVRGIGTVRSAGNSAEYDQLLATQRMELLLRIFRNRGLTEERLQLTAEVGPGAPLAIELQPVSSDNSADEKR